MLSIANIDVIETLRRFRRKGIKVGFLVPTTTGLHKSIMDATSDLRLFLSESGVHAFESQLQGEEHKKLVDTQLISGGRAISTKCSLYRPQTKSGDPRIWIYELSKYAQPGDLLALIKSDNGLIVVNCSNTDVDELLHRSASYPARPQSEGNEIREGLLPSSQIPMLIHAIQPSAAYIDLLGKLRNIAAKGYVRTMRSGDTGVGYTLESLLGIQANSSRAPDYKGIEIKSGRARTHSNGQTTVFSQVPDWAISRLKGTKEILRAHGRYNEARGRVQLFHEISTLAPNSYGLQLELDGAANYLHQIFISGDRRETDVTWAMNKLKDRLLEKHGETVWITADSRGSQENEEFWYRRLKHTDQVDPSALPILLETGAMTVHYTIKALPNGAAKDQGYLFKTATKNLELLFAKVEQIDL